MPITQFITGCFVCGKDLIYSEAPSESSCYYCGKSESGIVSCIDSHFVCDSCHRSDSIDIIEKHLNITKSVSATEIATFLMQIPGIKMHGLEHHYIVPGALIAAYHNYKGISKSRKKLLQYAKLRAEKVPGGFCGTHGNCGAGVGVGIFMSLITGATSLSGKEYRQCHLATSRSLHIIGLNGGPRCCKRNTRLAISEGIDLIKEYLNVELPREENITCTFSHINRECWETRCLYHKNKKLN